MSEAKGYKHNKPHNEEDEPADALGMDTRNELVRTRNLIKW